MRYLDIFKRIVTISLFSHTLLASAPGLAQVMQHKPAIEIKKSIAFYYNAIDSVRELMNYQRVVVNPALITNKQIATLHRAQTSVYAYLSVGEFSGQRIPAKLQTAAASKNPHWQSYVMDLTAPLWQQHLMTQARAYLSRGFDGLFVDTLDSYLLFSHQPAQQTAQQQALITLLGELQRLIPATKLIINRGFEIVAQLAQPPEALVAESLYHSYSPLDKSYHPAMASDSAWLNGKLAEVKALGIETIVIDYLPGGDREAQKKAAIDLLDQGYTPYVSDGLLYEFGVSTIEPIAKRILGLYNGRYGKLTDSSCHRFIAMPIEYQGYVPDCQDIQQMDFAAIDLSKYAAIVIWLDQNAYSSQPLLQAWLKKILHRRPILFVDSLPTDHQLLSALGADKGSRLTGKIKISKGQELLLTRGPILFNNFDQYIQWTVSEPSNQVKIAVTDEGNSTSAIYFSAPWGGAILSPLPITNLANNKEIWQIDPFRLIKETLNLAPIPAADVTTESGRQILTSHVDGDGFASTAWFPGKPYTSEILLQNIFKRYTFPQTVSVIEGEIGMQGLYPQKSPQLETIPKQIFSLPHIEAATHTFSHPFFWGTEKQNLDSRYGEHLPISGYSLDYHREIVGSANYINRRLLPPGKQVELMFWSGSADPSADVLAIAENAGLLNVNGGNTFVVYGDSDFTQVSPTISWYPSAVQVYAPTLNENLYTKLWNAHYAGYQRVIETFDLLSSPRRLKIISIYYHMYSGTYPASLNSLVSVYDWAMQQKVTPLHLREYAVRAQQLYETGLAKTLQGDWLITSSGIRSIRLPEALGFPVINMSNIAGWEVGPDGKYLTLVVPRTRLVLSAKNNKQMRLANANAPLTKWIKNGREINWAFTSHVPFELEIADGRDCQVTSTRPLKSTFSSLRRLVLKGQQAGMFEGQIICN